MASQRVQGGLVHHSISDERARPYSLRQHVPQPEQRAAMERILACELYPL